MTYKPHERASRLKGLTEDFILSEFEKHKAENKGPLSFTGTLNVGMNSLRKLKSKYPRFKASYDEYVVSRGSGRSVTFYTKYQEQKNPTL